MKFSIIFVLIFITSCAVNIVTSAIGGQTSFLLMFGMAVIAAAGWVTYASADAVSELGENKNFETYLEERD